MCIVTKSTPGSKLHRIRWKNMRVAYCVQCQRSYPWQTERCAQCGAKLVPKVERVQVEEQ